MTEVKAELNYLRIAPRKVRAVAGIVRGLNVGRAKSELKNLVRRPAKPLLKLLQSAIANAKNNFQLVEDGLKIKEIKVEAGPVFKRFRPRAFGRAAVIRKKTSHVHLVLEGFSAKAERAGEEKSVAAGALTESKRARAKLGEKTRKNLSEEEKIKGQKKTKSFTKRIFQRKAI